MIKKTYIYFMDNIFEEIHNEFINSDLFLQYIYEISHYGEK
jgi:hypothetical protein